MLLKIYLWGCIIFLIRAYFIAKELEENLHAQVSMLTSIVFAGLWPFILVRTFYDVFLKR